MALSEPSNVASSVQPTAEPGSIGIATMLLHRGRALQDSFGDVAFEGLSNLKTVDRDIVLQVSRQVNDPAKIRRLDWNNILTSRFVKLSLQANSNANSGGSL